MHLEDKPIIDRLACRLVEKHFRWFLPIYKEFPLEILRADSVRFNLTSEIHYKS